MSMLSKLISLLLAVFNYTTNKNGSKSSSQIEPHTVRGMLLLHAGGRAGLPLHDQRPIPRARVGGQRWLIPASHTKQSKEPKGYVTNHKRVDIREGAGPEKQAGAEVEPGYTARPGGGTGC